MIRDKLQFSALWFLSPGCCTNGDMLDVAAAAVLLKISQEMVYKKVRDNAIPYARGGRKLLFHRHTSSRSSLSCWASRTLRMGALPKEDEVVEEFEGP